MSIQYRCKKDLDKILEYEKKLYSKHHAFLPITESQVLRKHCVLLRKAEYHTLLQHKIRSTFYKARLYRFQNIYSIHIPMFTCGKGLNIAHVGPIIIHKDAHIGDNLRIHVGVNIGADQGNPPTLGNNIYIGPGAKVFGEIFLADDIKIGANAVVNKSCKKSGATLVGIPAHVIVKK